MSELDDPEWLEEKYHGEGMSLHDIADVTGCSHQTVRNRLVEHGIERRRPGRPCDADEDVLREEELRLLYEEERMTLQEIAGVAGCSYAKVYASMLEHGIETRGRGCLT